MANDTYPPSSMSNTGREQESTPFQYGDELASRQVNHNIASFEVAHLASQATDVAVSTTAFGTEMSVRKNEQIDIPHQAIGTLSKGIMTFRNGELFSEAS